jgi:nucleoside-diphosphate kinase
MAVERTLSIIKPDATERNLTGLIIARFEAAGLRVIAQKRIRWKRKDAKSFYQVHKGQPYYKGLIDFMTSGPIVVQVLEGENAIARNREIMGETNPVDAAPGTIRRDFAINHQRNSVHGSDSPESAKREIGALFKKSEIVG